MLRVDMESDDYFRDEPGRIMGRDPHPLQKAAHVKGKVWTDVAALEYRTMNSWSGLRKVS